MSAECAAASATPSALVSWAFVRKTGNPLRSACSCINKLFIDIGPSTFNCFSFKSKQDSMAFKMSCVWKQIDSNAARTIWFLVVNAVSPQIILSKKLSEPFSIGFVYNFVAIKLPFRITFPWWCVKTVDRRYKVNVARWKNTWRQRFWSLMRLQQAQSIAQPLQRSATNGNRSFQCINSWLIFSHFVCHCRDQSLPWNHFLFASVCHQEACISICHFRLTLFKTHLPN